MSLFRLVISGKQKINKQAESYSETMYLTAKNKQAAEEWATGIALSDGIYDIKIVALKKVVFKK